MAKLHPEGFGWAGDHLQNLCPFFLKLMVSKGLRGLVAQYQIPCSGIPKGGVVLACPFTHAHLTPVVAQWLFSPDGLGTWKLGREEGNESGAFFSENLEMVFFLVEPQHSYRAWAVSQLAQEDRTVLLESLLSMDYSQYPVCAVGHSSQALPELLLGQISPKQMGCEEYMC